MMKFKLGTAMLFLFVLSACGNDSNDGVPTVSDYENIVVNGKAMKHEEFIDKYCVGKITNETCLKVREAGRQIRMHTPYRSRNW